MLKRQIISELLEMRSDIKSAISEEMSLYDLTEYDAEFGVERELDFEEYPPELKDFLFEAWKEIDNITRKIAKIRHEYRNNIMLERFSSQHGFSFDDVQEIHEG